MQVIVEDGILTIRAERTPHYSRGEPVIVAERPQGSFTRQLALGEGVNSEKLTAAYADGVLHVIIPASPKMQPRRIEVSRAASSTRTISGTPVVENDKPRIAAATPAKDSW